MLTCYYPAKLCFEIRFAVNTYKKAARLSDFVQKVTEVNPAVILLDIQLGGYDGRELGKQIKEAKPLSHIPVILFSANHHYKSTIDEYLCDDFIDKPFELNFFVNKIRYYAQKV